MDLSEGGMFPRPSFLPWMTLRSNTRRRWRTPHSRYVIEDATVPKRRWASIHLPPTDSQKELDSILKDYVGRETPLYFAERLSQRFKR